MMKNEKKAIGNRRGRAVPKVIVMKRTLSTLEYRK
jgi:hypothetical protein